MTDTLPREIPSDPAEQAAKMPEWVKVAAKALVIETLDGVYATTLVAPGYPAWPIALTIWQWVPEPVDPDLALARDVLAEYPGAILSQPQLETVLVAMAKRVREAGK